MRDIYSDPEYVRELMAFNQRVLEKGELKQDRKYDVNAVKQAIQFNKIFFTNSVDLWQKNELDHRMLYKYYNESIKMYFSNVNKIINWMTNQLGIQFCKIGSTVTRLLAASILKDDLITEWPMATIGAEQFKSNVLYFMHIDDKKRIGISHIQSNSSIFVTTFEIERYKQYQRMQDAVEDYIRTVYDATIIIPFKVTVTDKQIVKFDFEVHDNPDGLAVWTSMESIIENFHDIPSFLNMWLIIDDLPAIIDQSMPLIVKESRYGITGDDGRIKDISPYEVFDHDILIEYPVTSFESYLKFLYNVIDNNATDIYIALYRIGYDPALFNMVKYAIHRGIMVSINIETRAKGENINRIWVDEFVRIGCKVTSYHHNISKVHSKMTLIKFRNGRMIAQFGTGNYHTLTTNQYTDLSLFTSNTAICNTAYNLFRLFDRSVDELHLYTDVDNTIDMLVAPIWAKSSIMTLIENEADKGNEGYICIKCNELSDRDIIRCLEKAAIAGCRVVLIVRGACLITPRSDMPSLIVKSFVWDKLEHSRVYCFGQVNPKVYIGSLDLVPHKLTKRIETMVRVMDPDIILSTCEYLNRYIINHEQSWRKYSTGLYELESQ